MASCKDHKSATTSKSGRRVTVAPPSALPTPIALAPPPAVPARQGGFIDDDEEEREFWCAICLSVLRHPRQLPCGHAYCLACLVKLAPRTSLSMLCPNCRREAVLPAEGVHKLPVDPKLVKDVRRLREKRREKMKEKRKLPCCGCGQSALCVMCPHCADQLCGACAAVHTLMLGTEVEALRGRLMRVKKQLQKEDIRDHRSNASRAVRSRSFVRRSRQGDAAIDTQLLDDLEIPLSKDTKRVLTTLKRALSSSKTLANVGDSATPGHQKSSGLPTSLIQQMESLAHQRVFLHKLMMFVEVRLSASEGDLQDEPESLDSDVESNASHRWKRRDLSSDDSEGRTLSPSTASTEDSDLECPDSGKRVPKTSDLDEETRNAPPSRGGASGSLRKTSRRRNRSRDNTMRSSGYRSRSTDKRSILIDEKHPNLLLFEATQSESDEAKTSSETQIQSAIGNAGEDLLEGQTDAPQTKNRQSQSSTRSRSRSSSRQKHTLQSTRSQTRAPMRCYDISLDDVPTAENRPETPSCASKVGSDRDKPRRTVSFLDPNQSPPSSAAGQGPLFLSLSSVTDPQQMLEDQSLFYRCKPSRSQQQFHHRSVMRRPTDVTWCHWNRAIYVTSSQYAKVVMFPGIKTDHTVRDTPRGPQSSDHGTKRRGTKPLSWGVRGNDPGQMLCPSAVACSPLDEEIYVLDKWRSRVVVFTLDGRFIREWGGKGRAPGQFSAPESLAVDGRGLLYIADTCNNRIQVLDRNGRPLRQLGGRELREPAGVAVSLDGKTVLVADTANHRCRVYCGVTGALLHTLGGRGSNQGQMEAPECVALDPCGFMLVGDSGNHRIQMFRPNGNFVRYLGCRNGQFGELKLVSGLTVTPALEVLAADFVQHTIMVY